MKNITDTLTPLMDKFRAKTGLTDKLTVARATNLMDHFDLHVSPNLLPQTEFTLNNDGYWENWNTFGKLKIKPNTDYTVSWRSKTSGKNTNVRIRIYDLKDAASNNFIVGPFEGYEFPLTSERQSLTFKVPADHPYDIAFYGNGSDEDSLDHKPVTFYDCKLEVGDLATPLTKVGGVVKAVLSALHLERRCLA